MKNIGPIMKWRHQEECDIGECPVGTTTPLFCNRTKASSKQKQDRKKRGAKKEKTGKGTRCHRGGLLIYFNVLLGS